MKITIGKDFVGSTTDNGRGTVAIHKHKPKVGSEEVVSIGMVVRQEEENWSSPYVIYMSRESLLEFLLEGMAFISEDTPEEKEVTLPKTLFAVESDRKRIGLMEPRRIPKTG